MLPLLTRIGGLFSSFDAENGGRTSGPTGLVKSTTIPMTSAMPIRKG